MSEYTPAINDITAENFAERMRACGLEKVGDMELAAQALTLDKLGPLTILNLFARINVPGRPLNSGERQFFMEHGINEAELDSLAGEPFYPGDRGRHCHKYLKVENISLASLYALNGHELILHFVHEGVDPRLIGYYASPFEF